MKIAISGSRNFNDYNYLKRQLKSYKITHIISGGAKGTDTLAEVYAKENNIPIEVIKPEWDLYGKKAGMIRNEIMLKKLGKNDLAIFFWDNESPGTKHGINFCKKNKINYIVFKYLENTLFLIKKRKGAK